MATFRPSNQADGSARSAGGGSHLASWSPRCARRSNGSTAAAAARRCRGPDHADADAAVGAGSEAGRSRQSSMSGRGGGDAERLRCGQHAGRERADAAGVACEIFWPAVARETTGERVGAGREDRVDMAGVVTAPTQCVEHVVDPDPGGEVVGRPSSRVRVEGDSIGPLPARAHGRGRGSGPGRLRPSRCLCSCAPGGRDGSGCCVAAWAEHDRHRHAVAGRCLSCARRVEQAELAWAVPVQRRRLGVVLDAAGDRVPQAFAPAVAQLGQAQGAPGRRSPNWAAAAHRRHRSGWSRCCRHPDRAGNRSPPGGSRRS